MTMNRAFWILIGFGAGVLTTSIGMTAVYFWLASPIRMVEQASGLELPAGTQLAWERSQRDGFFGQGYMLHVFNIPDEFASNLLADCPQGFRSGRFDESGLATTVREAGIQDDAVSCFYKKREGQHEDLVVVSGSRLFHLAIDS